MLYPYTTPITTTKTLSLNERQLNALVERTLTNKNIVEWDIEDVNEWNQITNKMDAKWLFSYVVSNGFHSIPTRNEVLINIH